MPSPWMSRPAAVERIKDRRLQKGPRARPAADVFMDRAIALTRDEPTACPCMDLLGRQAVKALSGVSLAGELIASAGFSDRSSPTPRADEDPDATSAVEKPTPRQPGPLSGAATAPSDPASLPRSLDIRLRGAAKCLEGLLAQWQLEISSAARTPIDEEISDLLNLLGAELQASARRASESKPRGAA